MVSRLNLLDFEQVSENKIQSLFSLADQIKNRKDSNKIAPRNRGEVLALMFFEASTRTRLSFETAAIRAGIGSFYFDSGATSSLEKGETLEDAILNVAAMKPNVLVIRAPATLPLKEICQKIEVPVLCAGWGSSSHPTQALLDVFTLRNHWAARGESVKAKRLLIVGDLKHSRVASSHIQLSKILGYEIGQCGPKNFLSEDKSLKSFSDLAEGLKWADAVMALRNQFERHSDGESFSKEIYREQFGLSHQSLRNLSTEGLIMHPGPINHGIELETDVLTDKRSVVLEQVQNGVYIREALLRQTLGETI